MAVKINRRNTSQIDFMKATKEIGKPVAALGGFALGKLALNQLQKSETVSGLLGTEWKNYLVPAIVTGAGLVGLGVKSIRQNTYLQLGMIGFSGAGVEAIIKKATGKTILQGLEGLIGVDGDSSEIKSLIPSMQRLPAADIDIEREIQASVSGAATDFSMSDEPIGSAASDFSMSDDIDYGVSSITGIKNIDPDSMDLDIFSGDMMES